MRGVGLTVATAVILLVLSASLLHATEIYSIREGILRAGVEKHIEIIDYEMIKRVLISDLLCKLDKYFSRGRLYDISTSPDEIVMPILHLWASEVEVSSKLFDVELTVSAGPGIGGKIIYDGGGYPLTLRLKIGIRGGLVETKINESISVKHTAKIYRVREEAIRYREKLREMIIEAAKKNETISFRYEGVEEGIHVYAKAEGGPEVYRYEVIAKDLGRGAVLDLQLDYGFIDRGLFRKESSD